MTKSSYANIPSDPAAVDQSEQHGRGRWLGTSLVATVVLALFAAVGFCLARGPGSLLRHGPLGDSSPQAVTELTVVGGDTCSKLWDQCGGESFSGPTCCEEGSVCKLKPLKQLKSFHQCVKGVETTSSSSSSSTASSECAKLWDQCGGKGFKGPTCCQEGSMCQHKALDDLPSYHQCQAKTEPTKASVKGKTCAEPEPGSPCYNQIEQDLGAVWSHPEDFHGLTPDMDKKEFQLMNNAWNKKNSQCAEPCAPGTCFFTLHVLGCDTLETWYCDQDDGSLKFSCCCDYFHKEKNLTKPKNPDPDMANAMKAVESSSPSFFCVAMSLPHGYELGLLQAQYSQGKVGLFACNDWAIYSNESLQITPAGEEPVVKTLLINGSLSAETGGDWGTALNTDVFIRFWDAVIQTKQAWENDWIVKVDPDTMWVPTRLRALLRTHVGPLGQPEPPGGHYLNNCHVGLHGPIEVLSKRALGNYKGGRKRCQKGKVSEIGQEDYFLRECFKLLGVEEVKAYNLMLEATLACQEVASAENPDRPPCFSPQVAFHPFKTIETWMRCHGEADNHPWALPVNPVTDEPSEENNRHG